MTKGHISDSATRKICKTRDGNNGYFEGLLTHRVSPSSLKIYLGEQFFSFSVDDFSDHS